MARDVFDTDFDTEDQTAFETEVEGNTFVATEEPEAPEQAPAETEADPHQDSIDEFEAQVKTALREADDATGVAAKSFLEGAVLAYRAITGGIKYKNLGKKWLQNEISNAINEARFPNAVTLNAINELIQAGSASAEPAVTVDPKEEYGKLIAAHETALDYLRENVPTDAEGYEVPDTETAFEELSNYLDWEGTEDRDEDDKPELGDVATVALAIIKGKKAKKARKSGGGTRVSSYDGPRRSVAKHIESAFEGLESGTFLKIVDITKHTSEEYGDDNPSSGAVAAALFPKSGKEREWTNLRPATDGQGVKGAIAV
ncbi:hypothetical protein BH765_gp95 [Gordonia phage Kvothe]|uniref:Uncharacterized protein n=1 Tax=Gordonia phage Kvothe TaxID=1838071 RepID=A0A166Y7K1_9CAUD|nr:hypothetical protein BH765_gp95 [Gordonia phage Kvothe]ANA86157.1 hypothetical protein PBI_KVOTHE_95 [Gordonia phage Kvothe]